MEPIVIGKIVSVLLNFRDQIQIYHLQTQSFARHEASDKLLKSLNTNIDLFTEVMQGSKNSRLVLPTNTSLKIFNYGDNEIEQFVRNFRDFLIKNLPTYLDSKIDKDLFNLRDDMVVDVNKALYLFSFN